MKQNCKIQNKCWGGKRESAGRKKTCRKKVPFNRRINEDILNMLKEYASAHNLTETEALESAIILQSNIEKMKGDKIMKIIVPSKEGKLCGHFGHCEYFSFVDVDNETKEIISIEEKVPEEGISCQSAKWISSQGANIVLAGGIGGGPLAVFAQNGIKVIAGCPEIEVDSVVKQYLEDTLSLGENSCGGGEHSCGEGHQHHHCHGHGHDHCHQ